MTICLLPLAAMAQTTYYVTSEATTPAAGTSWETATTLSDALTKAKAKDQIWVEAGTYRGSFSLKSGISLYGGFEGTESSPEERAIDSDKAYRMTHQTILSGDVNKDDEVDGVNLIFPANHSRDDNATHVLTIDLAPTQQSGNNNTERTVVDGITFKGGHADQANEYGGGIYVTGNNNGGGVYIIRRCFFLENYATRGGALYVTTGVVNTADECLIDRCGFFNNAAGERKDADNKGGAIYLAGAGTMVNCAVFNNENGGIYLANSAAKVINSTVTRNTASGIDGTGHEVRNTVIWGNSTLSSDNARPNFQNCAYPEANAEGANSGTNVYLAAKNNEENGPHFSSPSLKTGFDTDFTLNENNRYPLWTWEPMEATPLVDAGDNGAYDATEYGNVDLNGDPRIQGNTIDIGAFEYQPVSSSRIRYVKPNGTGDGSDWDNASGDLQRMIDELADNNPQGLPGEVWVAAGTYEPQSQLIQGSSYSASFRMRDGISVYGGFDAVSPELSKTDRKTKEGGMPWEFKNQTVLMAAYYVRNESNPSFTGNKWTLTSDSRHVVWFAPMPGEDTFIQPTYLDGVTIMGGYAQGGTGVDDFKTDRGAGVYMDGRNTYLTNSIVKENYATGNGGGVYVKDGRVQSTLIYNNNADQNGGAVYVDDQGLVHRSMLTNNSARNGAGVYLDNQPATQGEQDHPEYLILSTCVVSNNTASGNGAVYCDEGGVLLQNTITNNQCVTATDATDPNASQTGGIYINQYALVANSVIWNNRMSDGNNIPMYAKNPTADKVRFMYNAISGVNNAVWNNTLQEQTLSLVDQNAGTTDDPNSIGPRFEETGLPTGFDINTDFGVQDDWRDAEEEASAITYFWKPVNGSNLWARGMALGQLPSEVVLAPEIDIAGELFAQKPAVGAFHVEKSNIVPALEGNTLVVYVDADCTEPDHDGSSWTTAYRSINDAIAFFAGLSNGQEVPVAGNDTHTLTEAEQFEIRVLEGNLWPRYAFVNEDPKTATLDILAMQSGKPLKIVGGYYRNNGSSDDVQRDPLNHRSQLNGNPDGDSLDDGLYHVVTVESGANVELDGFHVINGYAAGTATLQYGAGLLAHPNADVTLTNCIFENNTAVTGAAIYAQGATLTLQNCVVNNNTNTTEANPVIVADNPTLLHVTVVNNQGAAPQDMGTTSFSAGNTSSNSLTIATTGEEGAQNFANPTNGTGATLGFNTYLGGYASFRPLTSSPLNPNPIINKGGSSDLANDIMGNERNLGGTPDLGAYEADLPKAGMVIYVRDYGENDTSTEGRDGSSWDKAINGRANYGTDDGINHDDIDNSNVYTDSQSLYITGLQYAVNQAYLKMVNRSEDGNIQYHSEHLNYIDRYIQWSSLSDTYTAEDAQRVQVWVGAGTYTSQAGLFMRDGVDVYGGFPKTGTPGMDDRNPRLETNQTILTTGGYQGPDLRCNREGGDESNTYDISGTVNNALANTTRRVLTQPLPYYRNGNELQNEEINGFKVETTWNGFIIEDGNTRINHQRDGGAGVALRQNGVLEDCIIRNNTNSIYTSGRGGGVFCNGGVLINCRIEDNVLNRLSGNRSVFGGGIYLRWGTTYNCVYAKNTLVNVQAKKWGSGVYIETGTFFNNTVVDNTGGVGLGVGQYFASQSALNLFNTIVYGNTHEIKDVPENVQIMRERQQASPSNLQITNCCIPSGGIGIFTSGDVYEGSSTSQANLTTSNLVTSNPDLTENYELSANSPCINSGISEGLMNEGQPVVLPSTDMNYTTRIKDCTIDIGAYERDNEDNTQPDENGVYYVTWTGFGNASANSPQNAACADKLQTVLNAAGTRANSGQTAIVKIAGYENDENGEFVYHANTLADENNPQSYTFVVPDGVTVTGGYFEGTFSNGVYQNDGWDEAKDDNVRNAVKFRTMLSATAVPTQGSTITQEVTGYHAVTFGEGDGTKALTKGATIDGVWLIDGSATSMAGAGNPATRGGGAIVPSGAHVRNCVVQGNSAIEGGGLYLLPGATVSGTAILDNSAANGGGVYADNTGITENTLSHIISCTIADNTADDGGGLFLEDGASMQVNTVIWGNEAPSNKNVSGVTGTRFADTQLANVFGNMNEGKFYPFNDCFVESQEMPSDFENSSMQSDEEVYFADELRTLKEFSPLIKHGVMNDYYNNTAPNKNDFIDVFNVAESDMQGISRVQIDNGAERVDAGAFAFNGGILPTDLFTRIFVSQAENVKLQDGKNMLDYLGKSFYTAFSTLEDALAYVRSMRKTDKGKDENFEILVSGGTYKPIYKRGDDESSPTVANDQRLYSFVVPHGVSIYGGFSGTEMYSTAGTEFIPAENDVMTMEAGGNINDILSARGLSDFNGNGIKEPWELANQTILSGNINVSAEVNNVYHVLYTNAPTGVNNPAPILLDGLTVMDGETFNELSNVNDNDEAGRGGGLYSNGVGYTINRCRFMNNFGLRGGAVYVRDARLNVIGSIFAGNGWTDASATTPPNQPARGGAIFIGGSRNGSPVSLYAVNSLFVNNETIGDGGAIGTTFAEGITSYVDPMLNIMNCTFARNKAKMNAVVYNHNGKSHLTNTLIWGNESELYNENTDAAHMQISHSASDYDYGKLFSAESGTNILLDKANTASNGPRFTRPSATAGIAGNDATCHWNPSGISVTTDKGDGIIPEDNGNKADAYTKWFGTDENGWKVVYMLKADGSTYDRYSGPTLYDDNGGEMPKKRTIDIGVYEYQYFSDFQRMPAIYVATEESGDGSGKDWANATSDLRGAITGASNPIEVPGNRTVYVRDGEYALERLSGGTAFTASVGDNEWSKGLTIKGACTGIGLKEDAQQDFANQSVIRNHEGTQTANLIAVHVNGDQYVRIEGFTFVNKSTSGTGIDASTNGTDSKFTLANSALRMNNTGVNISASSGSILIYNTLFADGGTGLSASTTENITLVNTTFANNNTDMIRDLTNVYNSVSWNNETQNMPTDEGKNNRNITFTGEASTNNEDIQNGPNFVDPLNQNKESRDYHIRPSLTLLNQGSNQHYIDNVLGEGSTEIPTDERDLGNSARLTDGTIDIGAYEYEAPLQPVVYVKAGLVNYENNDGSSWTKALEDLQGAIDLVGIYAHNHVGENGYVFVSGNVTYTNQVRVSLPNVKVYGGMNDETSDIDYKNEDGSIDTGKVNSLVNDLLAKRKGLLEGTRFSTLAGNTTINADGSVLDGFMVTGTPAINNGCLSSSIVNNTDGVTGEANGILYNTLVYGDVNGVKAVNVTATGSIGDAEGNANNRANVTETNTYVTTDHWKYQLMETSKDIDGGELQDLKQYTDMVGHERDIAGNRRVRGKVDNGCFETWNITPDMIEGNIVKEDDYPHDQSVVYVRKGKTKDAESAELVIEKKYTASEPFNPGVLLLEHHAGMRVEHDADGNNVGLSYVIMERDVLKGGVDMAYAPFKAKIENNGVSLKRYDAAARAAYDYTYNKGAWVDFTGTSYDGNEGLLLDNTQGTDAHVRFVGKGDNRNSYVYREGEGMNAPKQVSLKKENHSDPWTADNPGTNNKFTAKENMSWNLFGSPYLCAMNYEDMEYGRVIYGYQNGTYMTVNTDAENTTHEGYIPAGDAIFTQTATLKEAETFKVNPRVSEKSGTAYGSMAAVKLSITRMDDTRAAEGIAAGGDVLQLNTVTPDHARDDFDMGTDGVKWMADSVAQIYALQGGSRYSLLSAVNVEGKVSVGVTLPAPGLYTIQVPEDCLAEGYETIVLEDANTGKAVNLLEGGYDFSSATAGDIEGRFSISFNRMADDRQDDGIRAYSLSRGTIRVEGVAVGDRVSVYRTDGIMAGQGIASSTTEDVSANVSAVAIVKVERDGKTIAVKKIRVD